MKVIVAGGRDFVPEEKHRIWLVEQLEKLGCTEVVCGEARGADAFGKEIAGEMGIPVKSFPPDWNKHGKFAGIVRNGDMAVYADALVAFPGGRGTLNMISAAYRQGLITVRFVN